MQSGSRRKLTGRYPSEIRLVNGAEQRWEPSRAVTKRLERRRLEDVGNIARAPSSNGASSGPAPGAFDDRDVPGITVDFTSRPGIIARACEQSA
jgi:hypothetical protein